MLDLDGDRSGNWMSELFLTVAAKLIAPVSSN